MPFMIQPFPGQSYPPRYAQHADIRAYFGLGKLVTRSFGDGRPYQTVESERLPLDFQGEVELPLTDGRITTAIAYPSASNGTRKLSTHRVHVVCPDCRALVPAGRTHQHKCKQGGAK